MSAQTPRATKLALSATFAATAIAVVVFVNQRPDPVTTSFATPFLWLFTSLFFVRVAGQIVVRVRGPAWLPPTQDWNLSPYRLLLPAQVAILTLLAWIDISFSLGIGRPVHARRHLGDAVLVFAAVYAAVMAVRYVVRMSRQHDERWFGGTIPIFFHWVLAAYLFVFGSYVASL